MLTFKFITIFVIIFYDIGCQNLLIYFIELGIIADLEIMLFEGWGLDM